MLKKGGWEGVNWIHMAQDVHHSGIIVTSTTTAIVECVHGVAAHFTGPIAR